MNINYEPKVSIIIPVYNGSNYLADAIESALSQTYSNIEVIVVNDGSSDEGATEKIALSYGNKIKYIYKENGGVSSALNIGIKNMSGEYFSWLSHDDLYSPDKIAKQIPLLKDNKTIVLCSGGLIDAEKHPIRHYTKRIKRNEITGIKLFDFFLMGYALNGLGFLIPKRALQECGYFDENMKYLQDLDMWLRICASDFKFTLQKDLLVFSRIHIAQQTNRISNLFLIDRDFMVEKNFRILSNSKSEDKFKLIKRYYLLAVKGHDNAYKKTIKSYLKKNNEFKGVFLKSCYLSLYGLFLDLFRKIRLKIMVKNKVRN